MDIERVALPGIGLRYVFSTREGRRLGVVSHRNGRHDLLLYDEHDPDRVADSVHLTPEEADGLAELLGTTRFVERIGKLNEQVEGLVSARVTVEPGSPYAGRTLGDTQTRSRTGASIVAVARGDHVVASPRPDFVFEAGDIVVVVGTAEATGAVGDLFTEG